MSIETCRVCAALVMKHQLPRHKKWHAEQPLPRATKVLDLATKPQPMTSNPVEHSPVTNQLLNERAAREALGGLGRTKLYALTASGELQSVKIGRRRLWPAAAVNEFIRLRESTDERISL